MSVFKVFSCLEFSRFLRTWRDNNVASMRIICGPLAIEAGFDPQEWVLHIDCIERGQVRAGSYRFYDSKYILFRCLYGLFRTEGLHNTEWESADDHDFSFHGIYENIISTYTPYMRVRMSMGEDEGIDVLNFWSHAYLKIKPIYPRCRRTNVVAVYRSREVIEVPATGPERTLPTSNELGQELGFVNDNEQPRN